MISLLTYFQEKTFDANEDATEMVMHKDSKFAQSWAQFKENNQYVNKMFEYKMKYDESDHMAVRYELSAVLFGCCSCIASTRYTHWFVLRCGFLFCKRNFPVSIMPPFSAHSPSCFQNVARSDGESDHRFRLPFLQDGNVRSNDGDLQDGSLV